MLHLRIRIAVNLGDRRANFVETDGVVEQQCDVLEHAFARLGEVASTHDVVHAVHTEPARHHLLLDVAVPVVLGVAEPVHEPNVAGTGRRSVLDNDEDAVRIQILRPQLLKQLLTSIARDVEDDVEEKCRVHRLFHALKA